MERGRRLRLSGILIEPLTGVLYIFDEPSQGLHPADLEVIWQNIKLLKELGNTIIIVDHDEYCWRQADHIIELRPWRWHVNGGHIIASFAPREAHKYREKLSHGSNIKSSLHQKPTLGSKPPPS